MSNTVVTHVKKQVKTSGTKEGQPMRIGTGLPGPGRPKKADEKQASALGMAALKKKYGSLEKAFIALLDSKEPTLIKLAFEYSFGKPVETIKGVNEIPFTQLNIQVIATKKQDNGTDEPTDNGSIPVSTGKQ